MAVLEIDIRKLRDIPVCGCYVAENVSLPADAAPPSHSWPRQQERQTI